VRVVAARSFSQTPSSLRAVPRQVPRSALRDDAVQTEESYLLVSTHFSVGVERSMDFRTVRNAIVRTKPFGLDHPVKCAVPIAKTSGLDNVAHFPISFGGFPTLLPVLHKISLSHFDGATRHAGAFAQTHVDAADCDF
jgi:hypothetical protein